MPGCADAATVAWAPVTEAERPVWRRRAWRASSLPVAGALSLLALWGLFHTGGWGELLVGLLLGAVWCVATLRPPRVVRRRRAARRKSAPSGVDRVRGLAWAAVVGMAVGFVGWNGTSFLVYVNTHHTADPFELRAATWARDHGYNAIVNFLEEQKYSEPPSVDPAGDLSLGEGISTVSTTTTTEPEATAPPTTVDPGPQPPASLPTFFEPALAGEGQWTVLATAGGYPAVWGTSIRPYPEAGGVVATIAVIDQTYVRVGMFNGGEEPGGHWQRVNRVPAELYASLLAVFNGGFRQQDYGGGYMTEGKYVKPMRPGDGTIAIGRDGKLVIGEMGREIQDDGSWVSLRQNLMLMVDDGVSMVGTEKTKRVWWGANYGSEVYTIRSAVCELSDGRIAYAYVGDVDAGQMAQSLVNMGCVKAIQLDINGTWPNFQSFVHNPDGSLQPVFLDRRMGSNTYRYLRGSAKEFFAFFDIAQLPATSVLDA